MDPLIGSQKSQSSCRHSGPMVFALTCAGAIKYRPQLLKPVPGCPAEGEDVDVKAGEPQVGEGGGEVVLVLQQDPLRRPLQGLC